MPTYVLSKVQRTGAGQKVGDLVDQEAPSTELASGSIAGGDRLAAQDVSETDDPWKWVSFTALRTWLQGALQLNASRLTAGLVGTARLGSGTANDTKVLGGGQAWVDPFLLIRPVLSARGRDQSVIAGWGILNVLNGPAITDRQLQWKSAGQSFGATRQQSPSSDSDATITGLTNGTEYTLRFRARIAAGWGPWSAEVAATPRLASFVVSTTGTMATTWPWDTPNGRVHIETDFRPARTRDSAKDISLGTGDWTGGVSDGTTLWFVNSSSNQARAYNASTRARDSSKDISLATGSWTGGVSDGTTLWFVFGNSDQARAYNASTRARDSAKDISLGTGNWTGSVSDGTTLWFVDNNSDQARAYNASTRARDSAKDISLGTGSWAGGVSDGTTLWFVDNNSDPARAYNASTRARDSSNDISLGTGTVTGGVSDGTTLWFVNNTSDQARAYRSDDFTTTATIAGTTYGSAGSEHQELSGISQGATVSVTIGESGDFVLIYPEF